MSEQSEMSITVEFPTASDPAAKAEFVDRLKSLYLKKLEDYPAEYLNLVEPLNLAEYPDLDKFPEAEGGNYE